MNVWKTSVATAVVLGSFMGTFVGLAENRTTTAPATSAATRPGPEKLTLSLLMIADTNPIQYMFLVGESVAFKNVKSLEKFIADTPAGSTLTWAPGCWRTGNEPLLNSPRDMEAFQKFCAEHNVKLVILPSG